MIEFLNFLVWVLLVILLFIFIVGFNKQMMEKNKARDEKLRKAKEAKENKKS